MKKKKTTCINEQTINNLPLYMPGQCVITCFTVRDKFSDGFIVIADSLMVFDVVPYIGTTPPQGYSEVYNNGDIWIPDSEFHEDDGPIVHGHERPMKPNVLEFRDTFAQPVLDNLITVTPGETEASVSTTVNTPYANIIISNDGDLTVDGKTMPEMFGATQQQLDDIENTYNRTLSPQGVILPYGETEPKAYYYMDVDGGMTFCSYDDALAYVQDHGVK